MVMKMMMRLVDCAISGESIGHVVSSILLIYIKLSTNTYTSYSTPSIETYPY